MTTVREGDTVGVTRPDAVPQELGDSDIVGDNEGDSVTELVGVDPTGAQNGPMLGVARCVPSME